MGTPANHKKLELSKKNNKNKLKLFILVPDLMSLILTYTTSMRYTQSTPIGDDSIYIDN